MTSSADEVEHPDETEHLLAVASALSAAAEATLEAWVVAAIQSRLTQPADDALLARSHAAGERARIEVGEALRELLQTDIDRQPTNPLAILRRAVVYPTAVLVSAGVAPLTRDGDAVRIHPDDVYDLTPAAFSDFGPEVHEAGLLWGATKAHFHLRRRREAGMR